jgi:hypothetical protein
MFLILITNIKTHTKIISKLIINLEIVYKEQKKLIKLKIIINLNVIFLTL